MAVVTVVLTRKIEEVAAVQKRKNEVEVTVEEEMENVVVVGTEGAAAEISVAEVETGVEAEVVVGGVEAEIDAAGVTVENVGNEDVPEAEAEIEEFIVGIADQDLDHPVETGEGIEPGQEVQGGILHLEVH